MHLTLAQLLGRLSFRQLQVFQAVYQLQGYRRAAEQLGLTQPAVSSQIKKLEDALGHRLFEYVGRKIYPTQAGKKVAHCVELVFNDVDKLQSELTGLESQLSGDLQLSVVNTAQYAVPYIIKGFLQQFPAININVRVVNRAQALNMLDENTSDLVIMGLVPNDRSLSSLPFLDNELIPILSKNHPLTAKKHVSPQQFLDAGLLVREQGSGSRMALEQHCQANRLSFEPAMQMGSIDSLKHAVLAELGVTILPKLSVLAELKLGTLKTLDIKGFPLRRSWCLVYPKGKQHSPAAQAFIDHLMSSIKEINDYFTQLRSEV